MNKKLIRKMLTASEGPLRIKFDPERIARLEYLMTRIPGMNNSGGDRYRKEGILALLYQELEKKRKELEIRSRLERPYVIKRKASIPEKLRGINDEYEQTSQVVGMSGADPVGEFILAGIGLNGIGALAKTGLWNVAKYAPKTLLGNYGRNYFVSNSFKNSFNGNVPKLVVNPLTRTRVGDVEIDNPNLLYHLDRGDGAGAFSNQGAYVENGFLFPGTPKDSSATPYSWWNKGKPYATNVGGQPMTRLMIATENTPGMLHVRSQNYPIGQWNGRKGFVLNSEYVNPEGVNVSENLYTWKPGYGYKKITQEPSTSLAFFERKPSRISLAERIGIPKGERNLPFKPKLPTEHIQGEEAVRMFKEYGGTPIPEGSINGEQLRKYVAEARERYGLVGNNNVTDEEIAQALYKHSKELGGNTAAVNALGEPLLLFRGDTRRYTQLKERMSPEELATKSGTMDNSLGNLFLGEFPHSYRGVDRYIGTWRNFNGNPKLIGSGTGSKVVWDGKTASEIEGSPYLGPLAKGGYKLYSQPHRYGYIDVYKLPASMMESGVNDLNAFVVRTPLMRNASSEISVLNDDWMLQGAKDSHFMSKNYKYNPKTYSIENVKTGESLGEITTESAPESRVAMGDHYKELLKEAEQKQLGLLKSEANAPLRDEHSLYSYFVLPNFNIRGAKHLLPYDLRIPRNWKDKNIYRVAVPLTIGTTITTLKQGGKMNILEFLKNGSGIHIKKKNQGKFTKSAKAAGLTVQEHAKSVLNDPNATPLQKKRANFARNAAKWKHKEGGKAFVTGVNVLDSNPKAYKYVKRKMKKAAGGTKLNNETILTLGKTALNGILGFIQTSALNNNLLKLADALKAQNKVQPEDFWSMMELEANLEILNEMELAAAIKAMTGLTINVNPDMARNKVWKRVAENYSRLKKAIDDLNKAIDALVEAQKQSAWGNLAGGLILSGIGLLGNYLGNKTSTNSSNSGGGWTMNYNSLYGSKNNYNTFFLTGSLPKMSSVAAPNTSWLNNNPL